MTLVTIVVLVVLVLAVVGCSIVINNRLNQIDSVLDDIKQLRQADVARTQTLTEHYKSNSRQRRTPAELEARAREILASIQDHTA